jgi:hypothetical protein
MKTPSNDGGAAFPVMYVSEGMTLRDYFAGQALAGALADPNFNMPPAQLAELAYMEADAMLAARERKEDAK